MLSEGFSANKRDIDLRVAILIKHFDRFVAEYDLNPPFTPQQLKSHLLTIRRAQTQYSYKACTIRYAHGELARELRASFQYLNLLTPLLHALQSLFLSNLKESTHCGTATSSQLRFGA
jgi:hypothetical protein